MLLDRAMELQVSLAFTVYTLQVLAMQRFPEVGKSAQDDGRLFSDKSQPVPTPCESEML
jgi:hypothetical protein